LCVLRCLYGGSVAQDLMPIIIRRCGASEAEWAALLADGTAALRRGRYELTAEGRRTYRRAKVGRYF
jgi:hypothetical protein